MLDWIPEWAQGGAVGGALAGLIAALGRSITRRGEAAAKQDEASAAGILAIVAQLQALTTRCDALDKRVIELQDELDGEREQRVYWQQRFHEELSAHTATREAAMRLKREYERSLSATGPSHKSERPGITSQKKA